MTLEAIASIDLPNFLIYDTLPPTFENDDMSSSNFVGNMAGCSSAMLGSFPAPELVNGALPGSSMQGRKKRRRRPKTCKNKEDAENQRMAHIAVERNRRRQMNEHLAVLRSLMPEPYIQRGDQASIVGGAIDFVKELEQLLQSLEAQKRTLQQLRSKNDDGSQPVSSTNKKNNKSKDDKNCPPFAQFFAFPQYMWCHGPREHTPDDQMAVATADIEVTLVETHANLRILSPKRPGQLTKMVAGFQSLQLTILHLNVTTLDSMVLYSFSTKVEEECKLTTVEEIAAAVNHMLSSY